MLYCDSCRLKKNWPDSVPEEGRCEVCKKSGKCNDVPAVILVPESERSLEQKLLLQAMQQAFKEKADKIVITTLDGKINNRLTDMVREIFVNRGTEVDWYATLRLRQQAQQGYKQQEQMNRDKI